MATGKKPTLNVKIGTVNWQGWKEVGKIKTWEVISINQSWIRATIFKYINIYCCFEVPMTFLLLLLLPPLLLLLLHHHHHHHHHYRITIYSSQQKRAFPTYRTLKKGANQQKRRLKKWEHSHSFLK
jgi:hypothetical protein